MGGLWLPIRKFRAGREPPSIHPLGLIESAGEALSQPSGQQSWQGWLREMIWIKFNARIKGKLQGEEPLKPESIARTHPELLARDYTQALESKNSSFFSSKGEKSLQQSSGRTGRTVTLCILSHEPAQNAAFINLTQEPLEKAN